MHFDIEVYGGWMTGSEFISRCSVRDVSAPARMLLLSDGSLTLLLNAIYLKPITLGKLRQEEATLDHEMGDYIGTAAGQKVIDREVWLMNGGTRLIYANSILPISFLNDRIYDELTRGETPIGTILIDQSVMIKRDRLMIAEVTSPEISKELGIPHDSIFWARRYRLNAEGGFACAITEVFSPGMLEYCRDLWKPQK